MSILGTGKCSLSVHISQAVSEATLPAAVSLEMCLTKGKAPADVWDTFTLALKLSEEVGSHLDVVYALLPLKLSLPIFPLN